MQAHPFFIKNLFKKFFNNLQQPGVSIHQEITRMGLSKLCYSTNYKRHLVQQFDLTFDLILDLGQDLSH